MGYHWSQYSLRFGAKMCREKSVFCALVMIIGVSFQKEEKDEKSFKAVYPQYQTKNASNTFINSLTRVFPGSRL